MRKLLVCLLFPFFVHAETTEGWPPGIEGGLETAREHCLKPWIGEREVIVFWPDPKEGEEPYSFRVTCSDLLLYLQERDKVEEKA